MVTKYTLYLPSFGAITIQIMQIIDQLEIEFEEDRALKIAHAIEKAYEYRIYQNQPDSLKVFSQNIEQNKLQKN